MSTRSAPNWSCESLALLTQTVRSQFLAGLSPRQIRFILEDGLFWLWGGQRPPAGDWRTWLFLGGRGAGKTRAGAEWVNENARTGRFGRIALIGPTFHDVREVLVDGPSGIRRIARAAPAYEATRRRLVWSNGVEAHCFSAEDPESLRGPQFDAAWGDELAYWNDPAEVLNTLEHGLRLGPAPRLLLTTTPRPIDVVVSLAQAPPGVVTTRMTTWENSPNLSPDFIAALRAGYRNTVRERQELNAELIEEPEAALWRRAALEECRISIVPPLERIVVGVDPPAGMGGRADTCGVVVAGRFQRSGDACAVVLEDASVQGLRPEEWADHIVARARAHGAYLIAAEANNGGEMIRTLIRNAGCDLPVRLVYAKLGKRERAMPVAQIYAQGRILHAGVFKALEDEMCRYGDESFAGRSPDRMDALVWALTELTLNPRGEPRLRTL